MTKHHPKHEASAESSTDASKDKQVVNYQHLLYKHRQRLDTMWFYEIKEVDRRISYFLAKPSSLICDVGGAQGVDVFAFAEKGAFVIDLDTNGYALKFAKEFAHKCGLDLKLSFIRASATDLPLRSEVLDLVTCFSTLDHLPNKRSACSAIVEFSRVVRRSGHIAITVPNWLFLVGTVSMKLKDLTEPDAFFEQRFTPKELFAYLLQCGLEPIIFDSEFPKSVGPGILVSNFPRIVRKVPGIMSLLFFGAKVLDKFAKTRLAVLFGARMGYLSVKR